MDGQHLDHGGLYAYGSEEWPEFYDLWVESLFGTGPSEDSPVFQSVLGRLVAERNGAHAVHVVDIGTGTGRVIKNLWQEPDGFLGNVSFWGLDNAQAMLDRAKLTFGALEAAHHADNGRQNERAARLSPTWVKAPAADFTSHLPELVGKVDLIIFAAGGISHLTAGGEVIGFLTQVRRALRPPKDSQPARAVISVLYEMIPDKNPELEVKQEQSSVGPPSGEAPGDMDRILSRDHPGIVYVKSPMQSQWSRDIRTDSFTIQIIKEGEVIKEKDVAWSLQVFDEAAFKDAVEKCELRIEEVKEGKIQRCDIASDYAGASQSGKAPHYPITCLKIQTSPPSYHSATIDSFHHRDMTGNGQYGYPLPPFHSETSFRRSYPPTPRPSSFNHARNITPPEDMVSPPEEQHAAVKEFESPYDRVREYVDGFKDWHSGVKIKPSSQEDYENNFSIKMPLREWSKLSDDLNIFETDESFPKYSYNSSTSTLIVQFMPSPVHESITSTFLDGFAVAKSTLPASIRTRINTATNQDFQGFGGRYEGSSKRPDLGVEFRNAARKREIKFILEIGFSESYEDLVQDAKMWLEGKNDTYIFILIKFEEFPKYRNPARNLDDENLEQLGIPKASELDDLNFSLEGEYGPATYKGLTWVNCISAAFMEVWKRDPLNNNLATQSGDRIDLLVGQPQLEFKLSEFLDVTPESERTIFFRWDEYRLLLKDKIKQLAVSRCQSMLKHRAGPTDLRDGGYDESSSQESSLKPSLKPGDTDLLF